MNYQICQQTLELLPEKALFWKDKQMLLVADLHLGKASHFRKAGIPIPTEVHEADLQTLSKIIKTTNAQELTFLGDFFHAELNADWLRWEQWLKDRKNLKINLVRGNHDQLPDQLFTKHGIQVLEEPWVVEPFIFTHHPLAPEEISPEYFNMCGHLHPAVMVLGRGRKFLKFPCFYFSQQQAVLPAFGKFTGLSTIKAKKEDNIFATYGDKVLKMN